MRAAFFHKNTELPQKYSLKQRLGGLSQSVFCNFRDGWEGKQGARCQHQISYRGIKKLQSLCLSEWNCVCAQPTTGITQTLQPREGSQHPIGPTDSFHCVLASSFTVPSSVVTISCPLSFSCVSLYVPGKLKRLHSNWPQWWQIFCLLDVSETSFIERWAGDIQDLKCVIFFNDRKSISSLLTVRSLMSS